MSGADDRFHFPGPVDSSVEDPAWTGTPTEQRQYAHNLTEYTPFEFETCDGPNLRLSCSGGTDNAGNPGGIMNEGPYYHATYGHRGFYAPFMDSWIAGGCYGDVNNLMGYRFQLDSLSHPGSANRGQTVQLKVNLHDLGWARIYSARKLIVTLRNTSTGEEIAGTAGELRNLPSQSATPSTITVNVNIPSTATPGTYDVFLSVPDIYSTTASIPAFSVRFANANNGAQSWDATKARFKTGTSVVVN